MIHKVILFLSLTVLEGFLSSTIYMQCKRCVTFLVNIS